MTNPELAPDMPDNRYRKKPVVIDAMQFPGNIALSDFQTWLMKVDPDRKCMYTRDDRNRCTLSIKTLEGTMTANIDDWIIKGVKGELYPCKSDIFEATYERADLAPQAGSVDVEGLYVNSCNCEGDNHPCLKCAEDSGWNNCVDHLATSGRLK